MWCDRQQLWKAVITGILLQESSFLSEVAVKITWRRPEVKFVRNVVKEETTPKKKKKSNYQDEDKKSAINKKLNTFVEMWFSYLNKFNNLLIGLWRCEEKTKQSDTVNMSVNVFFLFRWNHILIHMMSSFLKICPSCIDILRSNV